MGLAAMLSKADGGKGLLTVSGNFFQRKFLERKKEINKSFHHELLSETKR